MSPRGGRGSGSASRPPPGGPAGSGGSDAELLDLVDHLGALLERSDLAELEVEAGATSILLRRAEAPVIAAVSGPSAAPAAGSMGGVEQRNPASAEPTSTRIRSVLAPLTGIFYAAPTPEAPPFVAVGVEVVVGQVIGLIEAMKLFNEIKSDVAGRVQRVVVESGQLVKARDPLIEVAPAA